MTSDDRRLNVELFESEINSKIREILNGIDYFPEFHL